MISARHHNSDMANDDRIPATDVHALAIGAQVGGDEPIEVGRGRWLREQACCCASRPTFRVVMPASVDRTRPVDLLLCGHHYHASRERLATLGASVYDRSDSLIASR